MPRLTSTTARKITYSGLPPEVEVPLVPVRQAVLAGRTDANRKANFLEAGVGLTVDLKASTVHPLIMTFAEGFDADGAVDHVAVTTTDLVSAWTLPTNSTRFLYVDMDAYGVLSFGSKAFAPKYNNTARFNQISLNMTGNNTPSPLVASASSSHPSYPPFLAFDGLTIEDNVHSAWVSADTAGPHWLRLDFGSGQSRLIVAYRIHINNNYVTTAPSRWTLQGSNNGSTWIALDVRTNVADWSETFVVSTPGNYRYYRLFNIVNNGYSAGEVDLYELELFEISPDSPDVFDPGIMQMLSADSTGYKPVRRLYLGEATTDGTKVTSVINYALQGRYIDQISSASSGVQVIKNHNLGIQDPLVSVLIADSENAPAKPTSVDSITRNTISFTPGVGKTVAYILVERGW